MTSAMKNKTNHAAHVGPLFNKEYQEGFAAIYRVRFGLLSKMKLISSNPIHELLYIECCKIYINTKD